MHRGPADLQSAALTTELCTHAGVVVFFACTHKQLLRHLIHFTDLHSGLSQSPIQALQAQARCHSDFAETGAGILCRIIAADHYLFCVVLCSQSIICALQNQKILALKLACLWSVERLLVGCTAKLQSRISVGCEVLIHANGIRRQLPAMPERAAKTDGFRSWLLLVVCFCRTLRLL